MEGDRQSTAPTSDLRQSCRLVASLAGSSSAKKEESNQLVTVLGGKASCRRKFVLHVQLLDSQGNVMQADGLSIVASVAFAHDHSPVPVPPPGLSDTVSPSGNEPPLFTTFHGVEFPAHTHPTRMIGGRAAFKLAISLLSSKFDNRLFCICFTPQADDELPHFLPDCTPCFSAPIRSISRKRTISAVGHYQLPIKDFAAVDYKQPNGVNLEAAEAQLPVGSSAAPAASCNCDQSYAAKADPPPPTPASVPPKNVVGQRCTSKAANVSQMCYCKDHLCTAPREANCNFDQRYASKSDPPPPIPASVPPKNVVDQRCTSTAANPAQICYCKDHLCKANIRGNKEMIYRLQETGCISPCNSATINSGHAISSIDECTDQNDPQSHYNSRICVDNYVTAIASALQQLEDGRPLSAPSLPVSCFNVVKPVRPLARKHPLISINRAGSLLASAHNGNLLQLQPTINETSAAAAGLSQRLQADDQGKVNGHNEGGFLYSTHMQQRQSYCMQRLDSIMQSFMCKSGRMGTQKLAAAENDPLEGAAAAGSVEENEEEVQLEEEERAIHYIELSLEEMSREIRKRKQEVCVRLQRRRLVMHDRHQHEARFHEFLIRSTHASSITDYPF